MFSQFDTSISMYLQNSNTITIKNGLTNTNKTMKTGCAPCFELFHSHKKQDQTHIHSPPGDIEKSRWFINAGGLRCFPKIIHLINPKRLKKPASALSQRFHEKAYLQRCGLHFEQV